VRARRPGTRRACRTLLVPVRAVAQQGLWRQPVMFVNEACPPSGVKNVAVLPSVSAKMAQPPPRRVRPPIAWPGDPCTVCPRTTCYLATRKNVERGECGHKQCSFPTRGKAAAPSPAASIMIGFSTSPLNPSAACNLYHITGARSGAGADGRRHRSSGRTDREHKIVGTPLRNRT
jgi:hypothetical protein